MPTLLDDRLVADALTALTDWTGDAQRIRRTVRIDSGGTDQLLADVKISADSMDHHPEIERTGDGVTFTLRTHSANGVTEYDIALASRIDDLLGKVLGKGTVAGAVTDEGLSSSGDVGSGQRPDGTTRDDVEVPSTPEATSERGEDLSGGPDIDRLEPLVGVRAGTSDVVPVPAPDTVPDTPQPGIGRPEGQGTPPAGHNVDLPADEGGPGDRS